MRLGTLAGLFFCCFIAACSNPAEPVVSQHEIDLSTKTDQLTIVHNPRLSSYVDSIYNIEKNKTPYLKAWRLKVHARYYESRGLYQKAILCADSAIAIIDKQNFADSAWNNYYYATNILKANLLYAAGNYEQAIDAYVKIKKRADSTGYKCDVSPNVDDYIGIILYKQQKYNDAKKYFRSAVGLLRRCSVSQFNAWLEQQYIDNIGLCFMNEGSLDSALVYYRKALNVIETGKFNRDPLQNRVSRDVCKGVVICNIARIFVKQNKLDSAEILFKQSIEINDTTFKNETKYAQLAQMSLAEVYGLKKQYPKMKLVLSDLRKNLDTVSNDDVELGWRKQMANYDNKNNLPLDELAHLKTYLSLKDSIDNAKIEATKADISRELKNKQQQIDIITLQKDNQLNRLYLWITIALSVMAAAIIVLIYYYYKRGKKNIQALTLLNREVGEQKDKLEFAVVELDKSNADKERILRVVAHDLRNPISGIVKLTDYIIKEDKPGEYLEKKLSLIEKTSANSLTLINELLELDFSARHIQTDKHPADINEIVKQCTALMQLIADKKNQKLQLSPLPKPLYLSIDKERIERMINNLVGNAIKFSPDGEKIFIDLEEKEQTVLLTIKDNGIGIPREMQAEVFNTFGNTRRKGTAGEKSFGLGLSICKQIVEAHNGKIWVESEEGRGTIFYVELPFS